MKIRETEFPERAERPLRNVAQPCAATSVYHYGCVSSLPSLCKERWRAKCAGRVAAYKYKP